jgi:hypothetical protein
LYDEQAAVEGELPGFCVVSWRSLNVDEQLFTILDAEKSWENA